MKQADFQKRVAVWMMECFSMDVCRDTTERNHRFLEEAIELVQALGCSASEAHQLVDYVFGRPLGDAPQEVGGVMVTLAALCIAVGMDMDAAAETELARIWTKIDQIRAKQSSKPKHSPLPSNSPIEDVLREVADLKKWDGSPTALALRAVAILNGGAK